MKRARAGRDPSTGKRTRAPRGQGELLRDEILSAAEELLVDTQNADAVSIRAIAERVRVTPPSIYLHFADKGALLFAICEKNFAALGAAMEDATTGLSDPIARLAAMGRAYVRFGLEHPEQYRILFLSKEAVSQIPRLQERLIGLAEFERVVAEVQDGIDAGAITAGDDAFLIAVGLWTAVHGLVSGMITAPYFPWPDTDRVVEHVIAVQCRGMRR